MSVSLDVQRTQDSLPTEHYDVVVVGAGPYGLSAAAHLQAQNLKVAVFGKPLHFWREHMPKGMLLRSYWWATDLSDPQGAYSFRRYFQAMGLQGTDPLPVETFIDYALWFQKQAVPDVDETYVTCVERVEPHFLVTLADGRMVQCRVVVMAPGLHYYRYCPPEYAHMPSELVSHSSEHHYLDIFTGKEVAVVGGGQAALETAALLHENGAKAYLVTRHPLRWIPYANTRIPRPLRELRAPKAGMGSGWLNLLLEKYPYAFQRLSRHMRDYVLTTRHGPAGSPWLKNRVFNKVAIQEQRLIAKVEEADGRVCLTCANGEIVTVDHVILATGYRTDLARLPMLHPLLRSAIRTYMKSPELNPWFESSVPGLYFIGFSAARSFGPFYRFVIGDAAAARRVTAAIVRQVAHSRR